MQCMTRRTPPSNRLMDHRDPKLLSLGEVEGLGSLASDERARRIHALVERINARASGADVVAVMATMAADERRKDPPAAGRARGRRGGGRALGRAQHRDRGLRAEHDLEERAPEHAEQRGAGVLPAGAEDRGLHEHLGAQSADRRLLGVRRIGDADRRAGLRSRRRRRWT